MIPLCLTAKGIFFVRVKYNYPKGDDDMSEYNGFRIDTEDAEIWRREKRFSDKFSDDDIERALREASIKVGKFVMPEKAHIKS